ncbi:MULTISPECIES: protein phosphatase 2C domain-containing protein [Actinosynnema]|uniref:PP2C family protein-serine/threonine phosphatase n=1 Tax=Actinosynnema TaxID=40566 RepID=UPI0027E386D8|nr:protein phosphatase 2C domain-containing protein [Actinosynnema pretiosum]MCP2094405.1 Serine/threonine protein phosphatase PrpC [Actinosynnema pretiosum]
MALVLNYAARSDRGLVRQNNEDSLYAGPRLLAVADGMGGHAGGEVASKAVIGALAPLDDHRLTGDPIEQLHAAVESGNSAINDLVAANPALASMGTTLTAVLFGGEWVVLLNIGDSRTYRMRDGALDQMTKDDSFVQSLVDAGYITQEEAEVHPKRSIVLRVLVGNDQVEPTTHLRRARAGDRFLLCSDGLSDVVDFEAIERAMREGDVVTCADTLISLALAGGGPDNVSVIVADVVDDDVPPGVTQPVEVQPTTPIPAQTQLLPVRSQLPVDGEPGPTQEVPLPGRQDAPGPTQVLRVPNQPETGETGEKTEKKRKAEKKRKGEKVDEPGEKSGKRWVPIVIAVVIVVAAAVATFALTWPTTP